MAERVGVVGLGLMGQSFLVNLLRAGFEVQGFDIDAGRMDAMRALGGVPVESPAAAARGVSYLLTSLPNSAIVREVALGPDGVVEGANEGLYFVDATTARPEDSAALAEELGRHGIQFLDAAVSGTSAMAREKDLIIIAGGRAEDFEACREFFAGFSRNAYYLGPVGSGALTKLIINLVLLAERFALAEGLVLGAKAGIDLERLLAILKDSAAGSKVMDQKGEKMVRGDYSQESRLVNSHKDVGLILEQGRSYGSPMVLTSAIAQIVGTASRTGYGELDGSAVFELLREMAGLPKRV